MATSITAAGIVFPDSSVQTTAASASGGTTEAIASGSLSNGSTVVVNANGTVSVISGTPAGAGSPVVFEAANTESISSTYDSVSNKVVVAYRDVGNSDYGTAVVGTVSGSSITFGTPVVFESAYTQDISPTFNSTNNKVVIAYYDGGNSGYGTAIVGTVSGTSISFGTAVVFRSAVTSSISSAYDSANVKTVIVYNDGGNSSYGTAIVGTVSGTSISFGSAAVFQSAQFRYSSVSYDSTNQKSIIFGYDGAAGNIGKARVGTVSGTSISFGTTVTFANADTTFISSAYSPTSNKVVAAFKDEGNSGFGTAIVGTVSGTSISFGTEVVFESASVLNTSTTFDSTNNKIVISYSDSGNSGFGTVIVGTISGTSISFGSPFIFESASTDKVSSVYNSTNNRVVIAYQDIGNSSYGTASVFLSTTITNLTSENFIGFSNAAYTNGQTATIQIAGAVDDAQTGLTAGQSYFVQTNGTLGLTPADPSVFAGTAISATKIVVQG